MRSWNQCEKCGGGTGAMESLCESVQLPGGIAATICNPCQRAFVLRALASQLNDLSAALAAQRDHYRDLALAGKPVAYEVRLAFQRNADAFSLELAEASVAWLGQKSEPLGTTDRG